MQIIKYGLGALAIQWTFWNPMQICTFHIYYFKYRCFFLNKFKIEMCKRAKCSLFIDIILCHVIDVNWMDKTSKEYIIILFTLFQVNLMHWKHFLISHSNNDFLPYHWAVIFPFSFISLPWPSHKNATNRRLSALWIRNLCDCW